VKEVTVLRTVLIGIDPNQVLVLSFESKEKTRMKNTVKFFQPFFFNYGGRMAYLLFVPVYFILKMG